MYFLRYSQYPSLWSVAGTTLTPSGSASGSITGGLTSQFLRGSSVSYSGLTSSLPVSSPSSMYDPGLSEVGVGDAQFESSIARLTASWAPVAQSYWVPDESQLRLWDWWCSMGHDLRWRSYKGWPTSRGNLEELLAVSTIRKLSIFKFTSCEYHNQELIRDNHLIIEYLYLQKPSWEF